jgi:sulfite exporter TauE/SafE
MTTNIAAISYIGKRVDRPRIVLFSGLAYTIGRMITYVAIGVLVVAGALSIPDVALFLQKHMNKLLGPILVIVGFLLLGVINIRLPGMGVSDRLAGRVEKWGVWGAGLLGLLFALSFCPISAALFFGSLIPLAVDYQSSFVMPTLYGVGTALPVVGFAVLIALGTGFVGSAFNRLRTFSKWAQRITAVVFIGVGIYLILVYLLGVPL